MIQINETDTIIDIDNKIEKGLNEYYTYDERNNIQNIYNNNPEKKTIKYGFRNGEYVSIHNVISGLKCGCICPECGGKLKARKGNKKVHHFSHHNPPLNCKYNGETELHFLGKYLIEQNKKIFLEYKKDDTYIINPKIFTFDEVITETSYNEKNIIFDIVCKNKNKDEPLFIEIANTHFKDEYYIEKHKDKDITCLEVDISNANNKEDLEKILFTDYGNQYKNIILKSNKFKDKERKSQILKKGEENFFIENMYKIQNKNKQIYNNDILKKDIINKLKEEKILYVSYMKDNRIDFNKILKFKDIEINKEKSGIVFDVKGIDTEGNIFYINIGKNIFESFRIKSFNMHMNYIEIHMNNNIDVFYTDYNNNIILSNEPTFYIKNTLI